MCGVTVENVNRKDRKADAKPDSSPSSETLGRKPKPAAQAVAKGVDSGMATDPVTTGKGASLPAGRRAANEVPGPKPPSRLIRDDGKNAMEVDTMTATRKHGKRFECVTL